MTRREIRASAERHDAIMAELSQMSVAMEILAQAALKPVVIEADDGVLRQRLNDLEGKLRNADEMALSLLARAEAAEARSTEDRDHLVARIADQAKRADIAESELVEARLDLNNAAEDFSRLTGEVANLTTRNAALVREATIASIEIASLRKEVATLKNRPVPAKTTATAAIVTTPLAEQVRILIGKGHTDASIRTIVNNYLAPEDWLNAGGVKAIRAMIEVAG